MACSDSELDDCKRDWLAVSVERRSMPDYCVLPAKMSAMLDAESEV